MMNNTICRVAGITAVVGAAIVAGTGVAGGVDRAAVEHPRPCERGEFCLWPGERYAGAVHRVALDNANTGECVPLPDGVDARSFANRGARPVTVYQSRECATESEFDTYPGGGTFVPEAPYVVRGVQIWEY